MKHDPFAALRCIPPMRRVLSATLIILSVVIALAAFGLRLGPNGYVEEHETVPDAKRPDQPDEAMRFRNLQLQDENGKIPVDGLLKGKAHVELMKEALVQRAVTTGSMEVAGVQPSDWVSIGPGNIGGRIRAIAIDPADANKIWIGSPSGGIWRTINGGTSWNPVDDFMANLAVSTLVINPANPNELYAGTGESFTVGGYQGLGVFKSTDGGVSWNQLASTNPAMNPPPPGCGVLGAVPCPGFWFWVNRLAISPDGSTVLAATTGGLARSTDGGNTWVQRGITNTLELDFRPGDSTQAILGQLARSFYTTDGGQTWTQANFTPPITDGGTRATNGRVELAYAGNGNPQIVFAAVNNNDGDVYRSTDGGQSYTRVNTGTNFFRDATPGAGNQGAYDNALWVNPVDANTVIVGGIDLWRSGDGGATFVKISRWQCGVGQNTPCQGQSAHADHHIMVAAPGFNNTTNRRVYFGNDGGIFRTDDVLGVGQTNGWVSLNNNLGITQFYHGAVTPDLVLIGGTQDNGNLRNPPDASFTPFYNPQAWDTPVGAEGDGGFVAVDPTDAAYVYAEYPSLLISRSSNGGANFSPISAGIMDAASANFVAPFILDPNNADRMLAGSLSLWRSNNVKSAATPTWVAIKSPVSDGAMPPNNVPISAIAVAQGNSNLIVVGHNGGEIFLTSNGTAPWQKIDTAATPKRLVTRLVIDTTRSPNWIYATFGGFSPDNVYVTKDLGATWSDITGSGATALPDIPVRALAISPVRPDFIYVGTELGLFASEDAGATWQLPQGGPANVSVEDLFWTGGYFTAVTYGRGFYTTNGRSFFQPGGGPGGGSGGCLYPATCPNNTCTPGWWDCPCTWGGANSPIPGPNDDVVVSCPVLVRSSFINPRSLRVNSHLTFANNASLITSGSVYNYGSISGVNYLQANSLVNAGNISASRLRIAGDLTSGGVISSSGGWGFSGGDEYPVQANNINLTNSGSLSATGVLCNGNLLIGPEASLHALSASTQSPAKEALYLRGNATNLGVLDVRGEFALSHASNGVTHTFWGSGEWTVGAFTLGDRYDPRFGGYATLSLAGDVTIDVTGLPAFPNSSMVISAQGTIKQNGFNLNLNTSSLWNYGQIDVGFGTLNLSSPSIKLGEPSGTGRITGLGPPGFVGTGTVNLSLDGNIYLEALLPTCQPSFNLLSGTVDLRSGMTVSGDFSIAAGATMNLNTGQLNLAGNATIDGTLSRTPPLTGGTLSFTGATLTNNGSVSGHQFYFNYGANAVPRNITIAGNGAWPGANLVRVGFPNAATTVALANDMTLNWNTLSIWSNSVISTGPSTVTMPCGSTFDTSSANLSGEIVGRVRRTNLGDCAGAAVPFTSGFTTVRFNSGTPPSDLTVNLALASPPAFATAVRRTYNITPNGGSGWTATLRLRYLDSELNGNNESALQLHRRDGTNWTAQAASARDTTANWVEVAGVTQFSPWALSAVAPVVPADSDGDGMSDQFEQQYFGSATGGDPAADGDGDGTNNLDEYRSGTSPLSAASVLRTLSTAMDESGAFTLTFPSISGKWYRAEYSSTPGAGGTWNLLQADIPGTGADIRITDHSAVDDPGRFYRILVLP